MNPAANYLDQILGDSTEAKMALREIPIFNGISLPLLDLLYRYSKVVALQEGVTLIKEGEFDQWVYLVITGKLAVFVGDERVDTIFNSLVGERCLLGEPRKATLKADKGGVTALGVDMALLDYLNQSSGQDISNVGLYIEMLSCVVQALINRVADLEYNQYDIASKFARFKESQEISVIINNLKENTYQHDKKINFTLYNYLSKHDKMKLAKSLEVDQFTIDSRALYAQCINDGHHHMLYEIAEIIRKTQSNQTHLEGPILSETTRNYNFHRLVGIIGDKMISHSETKKMAGQHNRTITDFAWRHNFKLQRDMNMELPPLFRWLKRDFGYTDFDIIEVLRLMLQATSDYTSKINTGIKTMLGSLTQLTFIKKLGEAAYDADYSIEEFFEHHTLDEMMPMITKGVLEVHLVHPVLERLGLDHPSATPPSPPSSPARDDSLQGMADSLFE
ncbi:MAG: hypothetical protein OEW12_05190 [Deltaproteobacteria bacterium]|nr:hypothetical protein [Deltaproteobacteria bacterium]